MLAWLHTRCWLSGLAVSHSSTSAVSVVAQQFVLFPRLLGGIDISYNSGCIESDYNFSLSLLPSHLIQFYLLALNGRARAPRVWCNDFPPFQGSVVQLGLFGFPYSFNWLRIDIYSPRSTAIMSTIYGLVVVISPGTIIAVGTVFPALGIVFVALRFYTRYIQKARLMMDDYLTLPALVSIIRATFVSILAC